jgi:MFS family permease
MITVFRALSQRNYRLFFIGQGISLIGTWMQNIALSWLVYRMTNSVFLLGIVGFASQVPTFFLAPFTGVLADRWNRHRMIVITQSLAMAQAFILAILTLTGIIGVWHIIALALLLGMINAFDIPIRQSFVVEMVERHDILGNAIALNSFLFNGARLVGPSIAGVLIGLVGEGMCFLINALSFLLVIFALLAMKIKPRKTHPTRRHILHELKEGLTYATGFAPIRSILLLLALVSLIGTPYTTFMPVFARDIFHGGPYTLGFLMAASGSGALIGAIYLASRKSVLGLGRMIATASSLFGSGLIAFSLSRVFPLSILFLLFIGFGMITQMASSNTMLQTIVDDDKRGRVMSFYAMAFTGTMPFGSLLGGSLASKIGVPSTLSIGGILCILGSITFARQLPALRPLVRGIYIKKGIISEATLGFEQQQ